MTSTEERILRQLVDREVIHIASSLIEHLRANPGEYEDELFQLSERHCDHTTRIDELDNLIDELETLIDTSEPEEAVAYQSSIDELQRERDQLEEDSEPQECLEFWIVSSWFGDKLREHGETVADVLDFTIWGRCTSGQSITADEVIRSIASEMEILPGQCHEWSAA